MKNFREEVEQLINKHSIENNSNTPDFVLAEYLANCLQAFNNAINKRESWHKNGTTKEMNKKNYIIDSEENSPNGFTGPHRF